MSEGPNSACLGCYITLRSSPREPFFSEELSRQMETWQVQVQGRPETAGDQ